MTKKPKVAFICVHNSCRSQIAEALARRFAADAMESYSAGTELKADVYKRQFVGRCAGFYSGLRVHGHFHSAGRISAAAQFRRAAYLSAHYRYRCFYLFAESVPDAVLLFRQIDAQHDYRRAAEHW